MKHLRFSLVGLALVFGANAQAVLIDFEEFEWAQSSGQSFTPHHPGSTILGASWGGRDHLHDRPPWRGQHDP